MTDALFSRSGGWRGTHSRATSQRAKTANRSRRFDWTHCRPLAAVACGAVSMGLLANAHQSFNVSDDLSMILFGVSALPFGGLCGWFLAPLAPKPVEDDLSEDERERWCKIALRCAFLREEIKRRKANHQAYGDLQDELRGHVETILAGR